MNDKHIEHMNYIVWEAQRNIVRKYTKGVQEHGGHLKDMPIKELLDNAIDEAVDQIVYLTTLRQKLEEEDV